MQKITSLIRSEVEFKAFLSCMRDVYSSFEWLPIAVNGLTGGAESAFVAEAVREAVDISDAPVLLLVESEAERQRLTDYLSSAGLNAVGYTGSYIIEREISGDQQTKDIAMARDLILSCLENEQ